MAKAKETGFEKSKIFDHFRPKYHNYHKTFYNTENSQSIGLDGDIPFDKFFDRTQKFNNTNLFHNDNYMLGLGTTKTTTNLPGYGGFIPKNSQKMHSTVNNDPYNIVLKTNHIQNYKNQELIYLIFITFRFNLLAISDH